MKYRIYIDEVGNNDMGHSSDENHRFLCLTGVIFNLDYVKYELNNDIDTFKNKYFDNHPDEPIILHRKEILNKKYPFKSLLDPLIEKSFNKDFLYLLEKWEFKTITVLIDKQEHQQKYNTWRYDPYHYCMAIIFERFYLHLMSIQEYGDMMFESRGGKEDLRLKKSYSKIYTTGTEWIKAEEISTRFTSGELKIKPKSANIGGLQVADLLAYPLYKYALKFFNLKEDHRETFNDKILEVIKPKILKRGNKIEGYGMKYLP